MSFVTFIAFSALYSSADDSYEKTENGGDAISVDSEVKR